MSGLIGKKLGMTSIFSETGINIPVTVIEAGPCRVIAVKSKEKDGYEAVQLGYGSAKEKHLAKPQIEMFKKINQSPCRILKEYRNFAAASINVGDEITVETFKVGEKVKVTSKSKGKGFQGVMRRHNFGGVGNATHGQHDRLRHPGSVGQSSCPSRVLKGTRMAGRMGYQDFTIKNLAIVKIIPEKNIIMVKGAVPGAINTIVEIKK